ncbi:hypothetical protein ALC57_00554 [Trachymyrmex cornetzi]|uniref:Helix-turn-helix domain-containing protein n=1 Tax=Trachymyrmex cornetzi TaxID=471704 RepID=A0A151JRK1_9HYME|nr:hypothetical protein ALC57_00554 [Trachymyrmex cornetzi]
MFSHLVSQKKGVVIEMIDRAFLLSHPKFHNKNIVFIIETLLNNDYPLDFIFDNVNARLKSLCYKQTLKQNSDKNSVDTKNFPWITIPYVQNILEKFKNITKD